MKQVNRAKRWYITKESQNIKIHSQTHTTMHIQTEKQGEKKREKKKDEKGHGGSKPVKREGRQE